MTARTALGFVFVLIATACGGSSSNPPLIDGHTDGSGPPPVDASPDIGYYDFGCGPNPACHLNDRCCVTLGATTTFTCEAPASCPMADQLDCNGPADCGGTTPVCCGVEVPDGTGSPGSCGLTSLGTSCTSAAACPTTLGTTCTETSKVQLCHVAADCTDPDNNKCCTFASGAASLTFCIDHTTAVLGGATCH